MFMFSLHCNISGSLPGVYSVSLSDNRGDEEEKTSSLESWVLKVLRELTSCSQELPGLSRGSGPFWVSKEEKLKKDSELRMVGSKEG